MVAWDFQTVSQGIFAQDDPNTDPSKFDFTANRFGLLLPTWQDLKGHVKALQDSAEPNVSYKVLFLARHGQGFHNLCIEKYGEAEWDQHWAKLTTDGLTLWGPDPELTELGVHQAKSVHHAWKEQLASGAPMPEGTLYCSPFTRSIETLLNTWDGIYEGIRGGPDGTDKVVLIKELLRETIGVHTCDKRSTRSEIAKRYPFFQIEDGFEEDDIYYQDDYRETIAELDDRIQRFLEFLFEQDAILETVPTYVSVTAHSGVLHSFCHVLKHVDFPVKTGGMIPVIVKATRN
ncbi:putative phosphomutase [Nadsonia fulvescens var. elongata DSM 6958]|uniref:Putative phosphomutase n=1 Tax=Nadsonia fulvescens var. elongata DSM 6958 TaxID=857566 RepID=A0A1E3PHP8_9ASCO|nr:putative phosphomutase [Nadsonia fulvescens var. elongata DSM 6958]